MSLLSTRKKNRKKNRKSETLAFVYSYTGYKFTKTNIKMPKTAVWEGDEKEPREFEKKYFEMISKRRENGELIISNKVARLGMGVIKLKEYSKLVGKDLSIAEKWEKDNFGNDTKVLKTINSKLRSIIEWRKKTLAEIN